MRRLLVAAAIGATAVLAWATPAHADGNIPVKSDCNQGWYVNSDEGDLAPEQTEAGFLFDGPSLVHHTMEPTKLSDLPKHAQLEYAGDVTGAEPLVKFETTAPYSTINIDKDGKFWSSKIAASSPGGQSNPVTEPGDLETLAPYTEATRVVTFGFGYANDAGNSAVVKSFTFAGKTYDLSCAPKPPAEKPQPKKCEAYLYAGTQTNLCAAGLTETGKVNCSDVKYRVTLVDKNVDPWGLDGNRGVKGVGCESNPLKPKPAASKSPAGQNQAAALPVTGTPVGTFVAVAIGGLALGGVALLVSRRRRTRFTA